MTAFNQLYKQPFPVGGGSKKFEDWGKEGGLKILGLGGVIDLGGYFSWGGGSVPHYMPCVHTVSYHPTPSGLTSMIFL